MSKTDLRPTRLPARGSLLVSCLVAGCSFLSPREDPSRFFLLTAPTDTDEVASSEGGSIAVGPVEMPSYLNGPLLVTRIDDHEVAISDFERWAEPLEDNFQRVLVENLSSSLDTRVVAFPAPLRESLRVRIPITVRRFDRDSRGAVALWVRWTIDDVATGEMLDGGEARINEPGTGSGSEATVATMSAAVARFSQVLAARLERLPPADR